MTYQVLARKWRPGTFGAMVGQQHVLRALVNALDNDRLHHAYLFTGTRGVGKTTVARILAKCLNCDVGVSSTPCGECVSCREIAEGRSVDLIEVDAASRTKVEDTRELLDNVQYAPTRSRFKIYLIDEVHMLSTHSFNALLKTLEEPPPHAKFLLATTDPQKLPATILSRCLQFNLKNMVPEQIVEYLGQVLSEEGVAHEPEALADLARAANGSMRDALSLADQAIAFGGGALNAAEVRDMLGTVDRGRVVALVEALIADDPAAALAGVAAIAAHAPDFVATLDELISLLHRMSIAQLVPDAVDSSYAGEAQVSELAARVSADTLQVWYQFAVNGRRDITVLTDQRAALEMVLLRMVAFRPAVVVAPADAEQPPAKKPEPPAPPVEPARAAVADSAETIAAAAPAASPPEAIATGDAAAEELPGPRAWPEFFESLGLAGILESVIQHCELERVVGRTMAFVLDEAHATLFSDRQKTSLGAVLSEHIGVPVQVEVRIGTGTGHTPAARRRQLEAERLQAAEAALAADAVLAALVEDFDATIIAGSVRPR